MPQPKLQPNAIATRIARALYDLGPGRHFDEDLIPAHRQAASCYVKPQGLQHVLSVLENRGLITVQRRRAYTTVEMTDKGRKAFETPPAAMTAGVTADTRTARIAHDFGPAPRTPVVSGAYIRPDGLQHTQVPSRAGSSITPYTAHV